MDGRSFVHFIFSTPERFFIKTAFFRLVLDFWGKNKGLRSTVIKGILSSGVRIVSFTESTADAEIVKESVSESESKVN